MAFQRGAVLLPVLLLAPACTLDEVPPLPAEPPPERAISCGVAFSPDEAVRLDVELAAERWGRATGCALDVGDAGVLVRIVASVRRPDGSEAPGVTSAARDLIEVSSRSRPEQWARTVLHEMGHALGGDHVESDGVLSGEKSRRDVIDEAALESVCARLDCARLSPEEP
jgi:hypothetical protein